MQTISVPIDARGKCDWSCLTPYRGEVAEIIRAFSAFLASAGKSAPVEELAARCPLLQEEAREVARLAGIGAEEVIAANAFYDLASGCCACTAFAVDGGGGPLHGHCLDWEDGAEILRDRAKLFRFRSPSCEFFSAGWPGFLGVFMANAAGRFALTLNAVWSADERRPSEPLGMTLRRAMATLASYDDLVTFLTHCEVGCDCLFLVTGTSPGEMAVVERTPRRAAVRTASDGILLVTNHYGGLAAGASVPGYTPTGREPFGIGSHERYREAAMRLNKDRPRSIEDCYRLLGEVPFSHERTIQRLALQAARDCILVAPVCIERRAASPGPG